MMESRLHLVCLLGTDHHHFARLVDWCDALAAARPAVDVLVQYGASAPPAFAHGCAYLGKAELADALRNAHVAVCHGGPGSISDVRAAGLLPLVVPRDPKQAEHVDGHQQRFVRRFAATGAVVEVLTQEAFLFQVDQALGAERGAGLDQRVEDARIGASVDRFAALVDELMSQGPAARRRGPRH